jgi:hypothetical protein
MFSHSAYGLTIHSEIALPELRPGDEVADVVIRFGSVSAPPTDLPRDTMRWLGGPINDLTIWWSFLGAVRIRGGREVTIDRLAGVDDRALRTIITGSIMGVLLLQRSPSVFHASAVNMPDGAVAFMAHKCHGKSTMASSLYTRGHALISDDLVVLDQVGNCLMVRPGFKEVKLWPDALEALGEHPEELERVNPVVEKRARPLNGRVVCAPVPLRRAYVLAFGREISVERLEPKEALLEVLPHWYGAQFEGELLPLVSLTDHLREVRRLVDRVPVYRLTRPGDLKLLPAVSEYVEQHGQGLLTAHEEGRQRS